MKALRLCYKGSFPLRQEFLQEQLPRLLPDLDQESRSNKSGQQVVRESALASQVGSVCSVGFRLYGHFSKAPLCQRFSPESRSLERASTALSSYHELCVQLYTESQNSVDLSQSCKMVFLRARYSCRCLVHRGRTVYEPCAT